ncbi:hypothetical protein [Epilithonimonas sp.]|uniref:hypothetical protein n=1 Tax=Epilithonimonas sp. TaxID=2894511 RepID=UPI0028AB584C|nr:hypothetical protein [Epilithonimonas sp.]
MKKITSFVLILLFVFSFAQKEKTSIKQEIKKIYSEFNQKNSELSKKYLLKYKGSKNKKLSDTENTALELSRKNDYKKYRDEIEPFIKLKLEKLKILLDKINEENPLIGKTIIYLKDDPVETLSIESAKKSPFYNDFEFIGITKNEEIDFVKRVENIQKIRKDLVENFDTSDFYDSDEITLSVKITFILDEDGFIKKVRPTETNNEEFAYFSALSLYEMNKKYEPSSYRGKPILSRYGLPIKMNFQ